MNRREVLVTAGTMAAIGAAGCLWGNDTTETPTTGGPDETTTTGIPTTSPGEQPALSVAAGESHLIPAGEAETYESVNVDGTLTVQGTLTVA